MIHGEILRTENKQEPNTFNLQGCNLSLYTSVNLFAHFTLSPNAQPKMTQNPSFLRS
jgi:hypothetical protein